MSDFYDAIMKEKPELPVVRGDMPDTWIHGYMSMPKEVKAAGMVKADAIGLEVLGTEMAIWGAGPNDITGKINSIYEKNMLFDEHTFGLAMSHGASGYWCYGDEFRQLRSDGIFDKIELSWREKGRHVTEAEILGKGTYSRKMEELAGSVKADGSRIVVYNPLPWSRTALVTLKHHSGWFPAKSLKDLSTGKITAISNEGNTIRFMATEVPAMGYKTFVPATAPEMVEPSPALVTENTDGVSLENEYFRIKIDKGSGQIISLINKTTGKDFVKKGSGYGMGEYLYERFGKENTESYAKAYIKGGWDWAPAELGRPNLNDDPYRKATGEASGIRLEKAGQTASVWLTFAATDKMPHNYSIRYRLVAGSSRLEVTWSIDGKPADPWPEGGWLCFPLNIDNPRFRLGRTGAVSDPATDFVKGSNYDYCFVQEGLAVLDENNRGIGLYSPDMPGISLDRPGLWRYSKDFVPSKANVFFNLYNNQWSTNFTEWIEGSWNASVYLWFIDDYENEESLITPALEQRHPMVPTFAAGPGGALPIAQSGISLSEKGLQVTAFGANSDGAGTLLRIWEKSGKSGRLTVTLPKGSSFSSASPCNLRGIKTGTAIPVTDGKIVLTFAPYQPISLILN
jgi:hypothetical protein